MPPSLKDYTPTFMNKDALTSGITYDLTVKDARKFYTSSDLHHHIFFGASMMFLATGKQQYKIDAHNYAFLPDTRALYGAHKFYNMAFVGQRMVRDRSYHDQHGPGYQR
jgi:hypothetical protein